MCVITAIVHQVPVVVEKEHKVLDIALKHVAEFEIDNIVSYDVLRFFNYFEGPNHLIPIRHSYIWINEESL